MVQQSFSTGTVISVRNSLWRVDQLDDQIVMAALIDSGNPGQQRFYLPIEDVSRSTLTGRQKSLSATPSAQDLLLQAHTLSTLHGMTPPLRIQRSRLIRKNFQLEPVALVLEM